MEDFVLLVFLGLNWFFLFIMVAFSSFVVFIKLCPEIFVSVALCISDVWVVKVFLLPAKEIRLIWLEGTWTTFEIERHLEKSWDLI